MARRSSARLIPILLLALMTLLLAPVALLADPVDPRPGIGPSKRVLLVQEDLPWSYNSDELALIEAQIPYAVVNSASLATTDLSNYLCVMLASKQNSTYYVNVTAASTAIGGFVAGGGILIANLAGIGSAQWTGGISCVAAPSNSIHVVDPTSSLVSGLDDAYFSNWAYSTLGYFTGLPAGANVTMQDGSGRPTCIDYPWGRGRVYATLQCAEWGYGDGTKSWSTLRPELLRREVRLSFAAISGVVAQGISNTGATISWTTGLPATSQVEFGPTASYGSLTTVDPTPLSAHSVPLSGLAADTLYHFRVRSIDALGVETISGDYTFRTATAPSAITFSGVSVSEITSTSVTINWSTNVPTDSAVDYGKSSAYGLTATADSVASPVLAHHVVLRGLTPSTRYHFEVRTASGAFPATPSADYTFVTGTAISSISASQITGQSALIVWLTDQPATSQVDYGLTTSYGLSTTLDMTPVAYHSVRLDSLNDGSLYHYRVRSVDIDGTEVFSGDYTFSTPRSRPPVISSIAAVNILATRATITWTTDVPASSQVDYEFTSNGYLHTTALDNTLVTSHSVNLTGLALGQLYYFRVRSKDSGGRESISTDLSFQTASTAEPVISGVTATPINAYGETITWTTNVPTNSQVDYGPTASYGSSSALDANMVTSHAVQLTGLIAGRLYHYRVRSSDGNSGTVTSNDYTFSTQALTISAVTPSAITYNSAAISWTTNLAADSQVEYGLTTSYGGLVSVNPNKVTSHLMNLTGLSPRTTYHYRVRSDDGAGTLIVSSDSTFRTANFGINSVTVTGLTETSATINWSTTAFASSQVDYGPTSSYGSTTPNDPAAATNHSVTITGLQPGQVYHFRVRSTDSLAETQVSGDGTFTSLGVVITGVTATNLTDNYALISWTTGTISTSQVEYGLTAGYGQSTAVSSSLVTSHWVALTDLAADTIYHYRVRSTDAGGSNAVSDDYTFRTTPPIVKNWSFALTATAGVIANSGACFIGANTASNDGKDSYDSFQPSMPDPNVQLYEMRNDWAGGNKLKSDFRAAYTNGTKVWSNWFIWTNADAGNTITFSCAPGTGGYAPPAGTYTCYDVTGGVAYDMMAADPAARTFDIPVEETGVVQRELRFVCTVGVGPSLYAAKAITTTGVSTSPIQCGPVLGGEGGPFIFGASMGRMICKATAAIDPVSQGPSFAHATLTAPASGNVVGRMAVYDGFVYGVTDTGRLVKRNMDGTAVGNYEYDAGANYPATPWVNADGTVLVACGNTIKLISATGNLVAASPDLGAPVGPIACPDFDMVWAGAGNRIYCLDAMLTTIHATDTQAGAGVFSQPEIRYGNCIAAYGNKLLKFNATTLRGDVVATAGGAVTSNPFFTLYGKALLPANDHKFYNINAFTGATTAFSLPFTGGFQTPPDIIGSAVYAEGGLTAVAGGADQNVYVIYPDGRVSFVGVNQATYGCVMYDAGRVCFTSSDGNIYVIQ